MAAALRQVGLVGIVWLGFANLMGQTVLSGRLHWNARWSKTIYIAALTSFEHTLITDSVRIDTAGYFEYTFSPGQAATGIFRLLLPPAGSGPYSFLDGPSENTFALIIPDSGRIDLEAEADSFYYSCRLNPSPVNQACLKLRDLKRPFLDFIQVIGQPGSSAINVPERSQQEVMDLWVELLGDYRLRLVKELRSQTHDQVLLLGLYDYFLSNLGSFASGFFEEVLNQIQEHQLPLYQYVAGRVRQEKFAGDSVTISGISLQDSAGYRQRLESFGAEYLILDFWASWCGPCRMANRKTLPGLVALAQKKGIPFIGINENRDRQDWLKALRLDRPSGHQYRDCKRPPSLRDYFGISSFPTYVVIDRAGKRCFESGSEAEIRKFIRNLPE